jgi:hypothetical protein
MWSILAKFGREGEDQAVAVLERAQIWASGQDSLKNFFAADLAAVHQLVFNANVMFSLSDKL